MPAVRKPKWDAAKAVRKSAHGSGATRHERVRDYLFEAEANDLARAAGSVGRNRLRDRLIILMMYRHGLRISEAVGMEWMQFDMPNKRVHVRRLKGSLDSTHPLQDDTIRLLRRIKKANKGEIHVFETEIGTTPEVSGISKIIVRAGVLAGLSFPVNPHMLRHGCGYYLAAKGTDLRLIQQYLGHKNVQNTVRYTQLSDHALRGLWS